MPFYNVLCAVILPYDHRGPFAGSTLGHITFLETGSGVHPVACVNETV